MIKHILPHQLFNALNNMSPLLILDIRCLSEFNKSHITGSKHIVFSEGNPIQSVQEALVSKSKYCPEFGIVVITGDDCNERLLLLSEVFVKNENGSWCLDSPQESHILDPVLISAVQCTAFDGFNLKYQKCLQFFADSKPSSVVAKRNYYASEIIPDFLYLGDSINGQDHQQLLSLGITHIVDATNERTSEMSASELSLAYMPVDIWDTEEDDISTFFAPTNQFISQALACDPLVCHGGDNPGSPLSCHAHVGCPLQADQCDHPPPQHPPDHRHGRVLVHCRAGISRSASLVLAYLVSRGHTLQHALTLVLRQRPVVCPNLAFRDQLRAYELAALAHRDFNAVDGSRGERECINGGSAAGDVAVSLPDDTAFLAVVAACRSPWTRAVVRSRDTNMERVPLACLPGAGAAGRPDPFSPSAMAESLPLSVAPPRPKKAFLRKGAGSARRLVRPADPPAAGPTSAEAGAPGGAEECADPAVAAEEQRATLADEGECVEK